MNQTNTMGVITGNVNVMECGMGIHGNIKIVIEKLLQQLDWERQEKHTP